MKLLKKLNFQSLLYRQRIIVTPELHDIRNQFWNHTRIQIQVYLAVWNKVRDQDLKRINK